MKSARTPLSFRPLPVLALLCLAWGWPGPVRARTPAAAQAGAAPREGCVWKIRDGDNTVYLAGSVHLLREEDHPVSTAYDLAYADSAEVVFEVDMGEMTSPEGMAKMQRLGMYPPEDSLEKHLKPGTIEQIRRYLGTHESGAMLTLALPRLKPGMVFLSISSLEAMRLKARPDLGLEMVFHQRAKADGKPVRGLETIEFQMTLFDRFTDAEIDDLLAKTLQDTDQMPEVLERMIALWHAGDADGLDRLLNEEMAEGGERLKKLLLTGRNESWLPEIEKALRGSKNVLFLVGAGHLVGKEGVVELLRKKGLPVEKVKPAPASRATPAAPGAKKAA